MVQLDENRFLTELDRLRQEADPRTPPAERPKSGTGTGTGSAAEDMRWAVDVCRQVALGLAHAHEGAVGADTAQDLRQLVPLPELLDLEELLLHVGAGASNDADGQEEVVVQEF